MTVLTNRPRQYWYALGLVAIVLFLASATSAQVQSQLPPVIGIHHEAVEPEDSRVSSVAISIGQSAVPQTETRPKPHVPVSTVTKAVEADVPNTDKADDPTSEAKFEPIKKFEIEQTVDPYRPWEHSKTSSRFLKPEADDDDPAQNGHSEKFHWKPAILQSMLIQGFQISYALAIQEKTHRVTVTGERNFQYRSTHIWMERDGRWQLVAHHSGDITQ